MKLMRTLSLVSVGAVLVACGGPPSEGANSATSSSTPSSPAATAATGGQPDDAASGKMTVTYEDATSPQAVAGRDLLQGAHGLETMADIVNGLFKLPYDIPLVGSQCDEVNAYWDPDAKKVTICYEFTDDAKKEFQAADDDDPDTSAVQTTIATFFHELGHMAITLYNLPAVGREEDAADQLAAYMLLQPGDDGKPDPELVASELDFAEYWQLDAKDEPGADDFADVHSLDQTRMYNVLCWIYGSDPDGNADFIGDDKLPEARAQTCPDEFTKLTNAWSTLLAPHLKS
ncbi:DUF4344 domain-containing metallopeptidase [Mycolicibacterium mageritense]|uniref:DUF4344 domain-containing metallopeptidase n=1 Tax=Mycolicibacterium mageritense TaxID=53462 RepID=UPI001E5046F6|nr:DUF4344 domain-containing metallopeptidase [Mycolicibacterium mageritense]GJJ24070.1 hypothetical protein MTY414_77440 [Mycolicibacterium mageritense]